MLSYRRRQNVKSSGVSGSPWLIGIWRFRPSVRILDRCAATLRAERPTASPSASANHRRADARVRRMRASYNGVAHLSVLVEIWLAHTDRNESREHDQSRDAERHRQQEE